MHTNLPTSEHYSPKSTISASLSHNTVEQQSSFVDRSKQCGSKFCIFPRWIKTPWHLGSQFHLPLLWHLQRSSQSLSRTSSTCWKHSSGRKWKRKIILEFNYEYNETPVWMDGGREMKNDWIKFCQVYVDMEI